MEAYVTHVLLGEVIFLFSGASLAGAGGSGGGGAGGGVAGGGGGVAGGGGGGGGAVAGDGTHHLRLVSQKSQ
ncbi:hypothetical protein KIN20_028225 [Parelaphostrongylus tenuis]|uniref:Uncharacterized protein n=1 Tax=Parelaphostrongylus tenuis TaxID=148309 RepID=A0AAD5R0Q6_PARTN|nr:hypothetical protein KIN20_028225 [Parelaphostrongylus tenuis]